ncbi:hypothetical protein A5777_09280 [Gordonia sp. 852002-10350_SCH5691597]|nr:hypothetical protein [Gordonia sp. 852002-10350_SCH5691597]OBA74084.1 hypothetical protein A5777_09280 [Gordonia sp. 852002-10350_SCH5691597]
MGKHRVHWPGERLCNSCFYLAMRTFGECPICGHNGVLTARSRANDPRPCCLKCGGINPADYRCTICGHEGEMYRRGQCARCSLRDKLEQLAPPPRRAALKELRTTLIDALTQAQRPESVMTWMRDAQVRALLHGLMTGSIPCTHEALDSIPPSKTVEHIRSILEQHTLLEPRDHYLALFERWLESKQSAADTPEVWATAHRFATWHHLRRIRANSSPRQSSEGSVRSAKQEITEVIKFLNWLNRVHHRTVENATQEDVDQYLKPGPTTRQLIRTFFVWCRALRINTSVTVEHRYARSTPSLTDEDRMRWIRTLMEGDVTSLHQRVAGLLLVLYAQPLSRVVTLQIGDLELTPTEMRISLGSEPTPVPEPFAVLIYELLEHRPNLQTAGADTMYLFPGYRPGRHIGSQTVMHTLRRLGINLRGSRNSALANLVQLAPPPIVADMLGFSCQVTERHAALAATTYARYVSSISQATRLRSGNS